MGRAARRCLQERHRLVQLRAHFSSGSSGKRRELQPQTWNRLGAGESTARLEENLMKTMRYVLLSNMLLVVAMASPRLQAQASPQAGTSEAVNAEDVPVVASYWTPERLAAAKPMDLAKVDPWCNSVFYPRARKGAAGLFQRRTAHRQHDVGSFAAPDSGAGREYGRPGGARVQLHLSL